LLTDVFVLIACEIVAVVLTSGVTTEVFVDVFNILFALETLDALSELVIF